MDTTFHSVELNLLLARLEWPVSSVRWWVMQELAYLLLNKARRSVVEASLRERLRGCAFETEIVEILQIFWLARLKDPKFSIDPGIGDEINARSLLSDQFLMSLNPGTERFGKNLAPFKAIQDCFKVPSDLLNAESVHFPIILRNTLRLMEAASGEPFEAQFFYEWENSKSRIPLRWSLMHHFLEGRPGSTTGQFFSSVSARARSAFLRTLTVSHEHNWLSTRELEDRAIMTLPLDPSTAWLRSNAPPFSLPQLASSDANSDPEEIVRQLLTASVSGKQILGAISWPVFYSKYEFVEIEIKLYWLENKLTKTKPPRNTIPNLLSGEALNLESTILYPASNEPIHGRSDYKPITHLIFPWRCGYAQADINFRGLYAPTSIAPSTVTAIPHRDCIQFYEDKKLLGSGGYWTNNWEPCYPVGAKPRIGTYLMVEKTFLSDLIAAQKKEGEIVFHWVAESFHKKNEIDSYETSQLEGKISLSEITKL